MAFTDFGIPFISQVCLYRVAVLPGYRCPRDIQVSVQNIFIEKYLGVLSMLSQALLDIPLTNVHDYLRLLPSDPNDVDALHIVKILVGQVYRVEFAPRIILTSHPVELYLRLPGFRQFRVFDASGDKKAFAQQGPYLSPPLYRPVPRAVLLSTLRAE